MRVSNVLSVVFVVFICRASKNVSTCYDLYGSNHHVVFVVACMALIFCCLCKSITNIPVQSFVTVYIYTTLSFLSAFTDARES